jgi:rhamnosyltransferase
MNLAAVVILYNPDIDLTKNINTYLKSVKSLIVLDNSNTNSAKMFLPNSEKITYHFDGENKGISYRLNQALEICKQNKFEYLLTMDQDSSFEEIEINNYLSKIEENKNFKIGMFGINLSQFDKNDYENEMFITSGSILNVNHAIEIGGFDENLFIDEVDNEFCLRLISKGYFTKRFGNISMNHQFGTTRKVLTPSLRFKERVIYSPLRNYYNTRNYFYVNRLYTYDYKQKRERLIMLKYRIKNSLLYENTLKTIYYVFRGYIDFKLNRMGRIK